MQEPSSPVPTAREEVPSSPLTPRKNTGELEDLLKQATCLQRLFGREARLFNRKTGHSAVVPMKYAFLVEELHKMRCGGTKARICSLLENYIFQEMPHIAVMFIEDGEVNFHQFS